MIAHKRLPAFGNLTVNLFVASLIFVFGFISEKPSLVRDLRGTSTCDSVTLTWKPPLTDGGMPINKYVLQYGEKSKTRNIDQRKTSYTITNLERNKVHNFILRATNKGEWGDITSKEVETKEFCKYEPVVKGAFL